MIDFDNPRNREAWLTLGGILFMAAFFVGLVVWLSSCEPPAKSPPLPADGTCEAACANLGRLGCPESKPNAKGMTCPEICERASLLRDMALECVASATDREALLECGSVRCR